MCASRVLPVVLTCLLLGCAPSWLIAQVDLDAESDDSTVMVRGTTGDVGVPQPVFQCAWRLTGSGAPVFEFQRTAEPEGSAFLALDQLMVAGLGAYLDARTHFSKQGVQADATADELLQVMNAMTIAAAGQFGAPDAFAGFNAPTRDQLMRLVRIDWSRTTFSVDGGGGDEKYLAIYRYVQSQREELERQLRADLLPLSGVDVLAPEVVALSPGQTERINSTCGTVFDQNNFLCALDLTVSDSSMALPDAALSTMIMDAIRTRPETPASGQVPRIRKRDQWLKAELDAINQRIDRMDQRKELWELRDRMDDVQGQIDDLRLTVENMEAPPDPAPVSDNPIAALSDLTGSNVTVRFAKYSTEIEAEFLLALNEVFEQLARSPVDRVLITGFTDRSGDAATNLRLSEQRAKAVRNYLLQRGIAAERLLVNYYGDSRSLGREPRERRVEIEWLR